MVMWYWSADNLIWQVSIDHNMMSFNEKVHGKPRLHVSVNLSLHTAGAREIWIDHSGFSRWERNQCPHVNVSWQERHWNQATFLIGDCSKYSLKGIYNSQPFQIAKSEKYETSWVSKPLIWRQIVFRRTWPCRIIVVLLWTKCAVRRQIKPVIL